MKFTGNCFLPTLQEKRQRTGIYKIKYKVKINVSLLIVKTLKKAILD